MRTPLTPDRVIDTALAMIERDGAVQLSMRKLAAELGVGVNSIYWHIGGRDELLDAVIRRAAERYGNIDIQGDTPPKRVLAVARHIWRDSRANQEIFVLAHDRGHTATVSLPLQLTLAREVSASGLTGFAAAEAVRGILYTVGGLLIIAFRPPTQETAENRWSEVEATDIEASLLAELRRQPDLNTLFEHTVGSLVEAVIPRAAP